MKDISETIEFFTPELGFDVSPYIATDQIQGIHHVGRYQWATLALAEKQPASVLDVACGAGYGSYMLARASPGSRVCGVDYDERAVAHAKTLYDAPNLTYATGDMTTWRSGGAPMPKPDVIVSFDTIEHLSHREIALMRMADNLTDDGWLILSTPCGHDETRLFPDWEHHKIEYSHFDLFALLSRFFHQVVQQHEAGFPAADFWPTRINVGRELYANRMNPVVCKAPIRPPAYRNAP
ncbi:MULTISPECIES: class I SAM-dependent methyltransferase [Inquilinus]|uniref:SAM-dependent methyltransferase n=1 Tax=Inquilinus ginsengisoli TaxID=363840 RepID=A0ABU1JU70_9PROT|nr:class I SAM-dependent methyltransferase [Inquilinus ginsengisoli]MDR6291539.1 SAM-dependent methyltransferase [Inquilinus ginsengisoli]